MDLCFRMICLESVLAKEGRGGESLKDWMPLKRPLQASERGELVPEWGISAEKVL